MMGEYIQFWLAKTASEVLVVLAVVVVICLWVALASIPNILRHFRCKHESVRENGRLDSICNKCGKNLGFIGSWRKRRPIDTPEKQ